MNLPKNLMSTNGDVTGVLLVGHGTRDSIGRAEFFQVCALVAQRIQLPTRPCFLELAEPTIDQAVDELAHRGVQRLLVAPLLLFAAGHAQRDIPSTVRAAVRGRMKIQQAAHLGCHPSLVRLSALRCRAATEPLEHAPNCALSVLVGRGSRETSATSEMVRFVRLRHDAVPAKKTVHGFIAMASPPVEEVLRNAENHLSDPVVVQPHLLFHGELSEKTAELVRRFQRINPDQSWIAAPYLGPHPLLVDAIVDRIGEIPR